MSLLNYRAGQAIFTAATDIFPVQSQAITTSSKYDTPLKNGAAYQVTAGKTFYIVSVISITDTAIAAVTVGYGDTSVSISASPPTNYVAMCSGFGMPTAWSANIVSGIIIPIPATKYPCIFSNQVTGARIYITLMGFEA